MTEEEFYTSNDAVDLHNRDNSSIDMTKEDSDAYQKFQESLFLTESEFEICSKIDEELQRIEVSANYKKEDEVVDAWKKSLMHFWPEVHVSQRLKTKKVMLHEDMHVYAAVFKAGRPYLTLGIFKDGGAAMLDQARYDAFERGPYAWPFEKSLLLKFKK